MLRGTKPPWSWFDTLVGVAVVLQVGLLAWQLWSRDWGGYDLGYEPVQPVAFSHRLHSGEMQISCVYCHPAARSARWAGTPPVSLCMNCHRFVQARLGAVREEEKQAAAEGRPPRRLLSEEIAKLYAAMGVDQDLNPVGPGEPIRWVRVHRLPDFVRFHHGVHYSAGVPCQTCHGAVEQMERVRQAATLSMGWCVQCHRDYSGRPAGERILQPSLDCSSCHY